MVIKLTTLGALLIMGMLAVSGCQRVNSGFGGVLNLETNVTIDLKVESDINPDERQTPSPLYVRLYQLKDKKLFERADFIQLYDQDEATLGADFISSQKLKLLQPGQSRKEKLVLEEETKFIGFYAEFFQYKDSAYKFVVPVTSDNVIRNLVRVNISGNKMKLVEK